MTDVAEHINAMKRKYDAAVHAKEIQSLIRGIEVRSKYVCDYITLICYFQDLDLTKYGDIIEEVGV